MHSMLALDYEPSLQGFQASSAPGLLGSSMAVIIPCLLRNADSPTGQYLALK